MKNTANWSNNKRDNLHSSFNINSTDNLHKEQNKMHYFNDEISCITTINQQRM